MRLAAAIALALIGAPALAHANYSVTEQRKEWNGAVGKLPIRDKMMKSKRKYLAR